MSTSLYEDTPVLLLLLLLDVGDGVVDLVDPDSILTGFDILSATTLLFSKNSSTSAFIILLFGPVPCILERSILLPLARVLANGDANTLLPLLLAWFWFWFVAWCDWELLFWFETLEEDVGVGFTLLASSKE